jgi:pentalenene oxygenase
MKDERPIPTAPGTFPVIGHLIPMIKDPLAFLSSLPRYGDLVTIHVGPTRITMVCDPELTHHVLTDDRTFDKGGTFIERCREIMRNGVGTCPRVDHRRQRRHIQPLFRVGHLPQYIPDMNSCIADVLSAWHDGKHVNVVEEMQKISARVIAATLFSNTLAPAELEALFSDFDVLGEGLYQRMLVPSYLAKLPILKKRSFDQASSRVRYTVDTIVADRRKIPTPHGDLLSHLIDANSPENKDRAIKDGEISDTVVTFFLAGIETIAATLAWTFHLLDQHPHIEQKLHSEITTALNGRAPTDLELNRLHYTHQVLIETLRHSGPAVLFTRCVTTDIRLGDHFLPAGTTVAYSPWIIHHREDTYPHPHVFDPDRWNPDLNTAPPRYAFIPFGGGARLCTGDNFSLIEAKLALAAILTRWKLRTLPGQDTRPSFSGVLRPRKLTMKISAR